MTNKNSSDGVTPDPHRNKRPTFIPRPIFREWLTSTQLSKLFLVGGILPASYAAKRERLGRPIARRGSQWRPLDLVAAAHADCLDVTPPTRVIAQRTLEDLEREIAAANQKLLQLQHELRSVNAKNEIHAMVDMSFSFTGRRMANEEEILDMSRPVHKLCGVYFLIQNEDIVYIGQSTNIFGRLASHSDKQFTHVTALLVPREHLNFVESVYILAMRPKLNGPPIYSLAQLAEISTNIPQERLQSYNGSGRGSKFLSY